MEIIVLGSGTSHGVPMIGCGCAVCGSSDPRDQRTRASVHVVMDGLMIQVDAAPEFRLQVLRERIPKIDLFILTHGHADHLLGMDDLRRYCELVPGGVLPVYCNDEGRQRIERVYPYALTPVGERPDSYARFDLRAMPGRLELPQGTIESTPLPHGRVETLGLVFTERSTGARFAYYTDCKTVPPEACVLAQGVEVLILDGLRPHPHVTHLSFAEAQAIARQIGAGESYLTHLAHAVPHIYGKTLQPEVDGFVYDGWRRVL